MQQIGEMISSYNENIEFDENLGEIKPNLTDLPPITFTKDIWFDSKNY